MTISHIGKKVLFPDKKLLIHLWKFVHIFMGGGNKLHITYQEIAIQMFWKTVYHPFYRISVLPSKLIPLPVSQRIHFTRNLRVGEKTHSDNRINQFLFGRKVVYDSPFGFMHGDSHIAE